MSITTTLIKHFGLSQNLSQLEAIVYHPKMILVENNNVVHIVNLIQDIEVKINDLDHLVELGDEVIDKANQDNYMWLILKTHQIVIIDVLSGCQLNLVVDNYKVCKFKWCNDGLFLISEGGECLNMPYSSLTLKEKFKNTGTGTANETVFLEKSSKHHGASPLMETNVKVDSWHGLCTHAESNNFIIKCPVTDLQECASLNVRVQHSVLWNDVVVLAHESDMWVVDFKNADIIFKFPNGAPKFYYPVTVHNNTLYYVAWSESQMHICCALNSVASFKEEFMDKDSLDTTGVKLSSQETLKTQLITLVDKIVSENNPVEVMGQLQTYFEKIDDNILLLDVASQLCRHNLIYKSILYSFQKKVFATGNNDLVNVLADLVIKVDLLEYICFKGNNNYAQIDLFEKKFKELCVIFLSYSDFDLASICCLKYNEVKLSISSQDVNDILNSIPYNIKMGTLIIWLKNFVPSLLDENPFFIDIFVKWTVERVFKLEQSVYWPKIGLKFIEEIITVLEVSLKMVTVRPVSMDDLDILKDRINYIMELKEKYKINMLLSELSSQSPNEVALIMLHRCYTEDLEIFLQNYLPFYSARHLFDLDETLRSYIESEAAISGGGVDGLRLKIMLSAFRSTTTKLDCLLQVLKVLHVPWDVNVLELAVAAAASASNDFTVTDIDRTLAHEIQKELNYAKVKVILKKYNFPPTYTDYMLVLKKLTMAVTVDLEDLKVIASVMTVLKNYGDFLFVNRCLIDCETKTALDYFKQLSFKDKNILIKTVMNKYEQMINAGTTSLMSLENNYLDFLKGTLLLTEIQLKDAENLYHLKSSYSIIINFNSLYVENICTEKTTAWMRDGGHTTSSARGGCISRLTRTQQSKHSFLSNLLRQSSTNHAVRKFIENLLWPGSVGITPFACFKNANNSKLLLESFNILIELVVKCDEDHLHLLMNYLSILNSLVNADIILKNLSVAWKFQYIYLPMSSITGMNDLINYTEQFVSDNLSDEDVCNISEGYDFIPFRMISQFLGKSVVTELALSDNFYIVRDKISRKLLSKAILCQEVDEVLITTLLHILSRFEGTNDTWLTDTLRGTSEALSPAVMCYLSLPVMRRMFILDGNCRNVVSYPPQYVLKSKFNINLTDIALPDSTEETWDVKILLLCVLKQYPTTSFDRLIDLCRTLNVSLNDGLTLQLICLLASFELKYKINSDDFYVRQIQYENDEKELISQCFIIWENIDNKDFVRDVLNDFWKNGEVSLHGRSISINPYYYEVYICIYHLIFGPCTESRDIKEYFLLNYLKDYRRTSPPKQYEFELFSVKGMFPEVGYYRLPFQLFIREDMWSNLKSEITLETYERWLPVVALLSLDGDEQTARDMICSNALKQTMTARKHPDGSSLEGKESEPWRLITREEPLLRAAHRCVRHIANMEWAGACLFYVLQGCARGADQVAAAQLCYQFAQKWAAVQPGNRAVRQMERLHLTLSTRHALHKIEWVCEEFVRLSTEPAQLIRALYLHPSFVEKMARHDINRAANEIADKNGINISSIRIQILENILEKSYEENKNKKITGLNTRELMTAKYILKATCPKMGAIYLSRIALDDESDYNKCKKLRALQCLISVIEADTAVKVTNLEREALWTSLLDLLSIVNLENVDMPWVVATFTQDKIRAIEQLLQAGTNVEGLKIAAELARRYGNLKIIRDLIPMLLRSCLYEEMTSLLLKASSPPNEVICTAWRIVIVSPFQRADYPITEKQRKNCLNALNLLPVCPIIKDEDLVEIWKNCLRCKCLGIGCLVLPYMTSQVRQSLNELHKVDKRNLVASLKNLHSESYLVSGAMYVIENMSFKGK